jgi:hypothetical protein
MTQVHKRFTDQQVKDLIERYLKKEIERKYIQEMLGIKKVRFFALIKKYREAPEKFSIQYTRGGAPRSIDPAIEKNILKELSTDRKLIDNPAVPLRRYNYSYIKDRLATVYKQTVSLPTIIRKAKQHNFYIQRGPRKKHHDREVLTHYIGELIQHDTSYHLWAPDSGQKWCLITSLDDHSRFIPYGDLVERESSWTHIAALQTVILRYGCPLSYYVDCHAIFRYIKGRDQIHRSFEKFTDDVSPQWKKVLEDCQIKVTYALSPQAKGKIERPYGWLQDRLIRSCVRENVTTIGHARRILALELHRYNCKQVHSTTGEIPFVRFQRAQQNQQTLFRPFRLPPPLLTIKDIFALRASRFVDNYRKINIGKLHLPVKDSEERQSIDLRIHILNDSFSELRCWSRGKLLDIHRVKNTDLLPVHF